MKTSLGLKWIAWSFSWFFVGTAIVFPIVGIMFHLKGDINPDEWMWTKSILKFSIRQAFWSTMVSALIGIPLGFVFGKSLRAQRRSARLAVSFFSMTFSIPTVVAATAWVLWLRGWEHWAYSGRAVILAHVFLNAPWVLVRVAQARSEIHLSEEETAKTLGAGVWQRGLHVIWPHTRGTVLLVLLQVFQLCLTSFGIVMILGGGPPVQTLETEIYAKIRYGGLDLAGAARYAALQMALTLPVGLIAFWMEKKWRVPASSLNQRRDLSRRYRWVAYAFLGISLFFISPYFVLAEAMAHLNFAEIFSEIARPLLVSLLIAVLSTVGTLGVCALVLVALKHSSPRGAWLLDGLSQLPSGLSVLVISLGFWVVYGGVLDLFEGSGVAMVVLQTVIFLPFALRYLKPLLGGSRIREEEAAATLGAPPFRRWVAVEWPRWRRPVGVVAWMIFAISLGEVATVSLFYSENLLTLPVVVMRWMSQYRFDEANGLSFFLFLLAGASSFWSVSIKESVK